MFNIDRSKKSGLQSKCRTCKSSYQKSNRDKNRIYKQRHLHKTKPDRLLMSTRKRLLRFLIKRLKTLHCNKNKNRIIFKTNTHKYCNGCNQLLEHQSFHRDVDNGGLARRCRICMRHKWVKRRGEKRGMTEDLTINMTWSIYRTFNNKCFNCDAKDDLSIDHHINNEPLSFSNAVILCRTCNRSKGQKDPHDFYDSEQIKALSIMHIGK